MLTLVLFGAIFSSIVWFVYAFRFVITSLSGMSFFDAGILNVLLYGLFVCLPVFLVWVVFGFISQYIHNRTISRQMYKLFSQMKKNQEYSDLLARIMLETEQNIKNSSILNRFDVLIADMNELLSELLLRERLVSAEQIEHLWIKVQNGGKWSFGKVLIENYNRQPAFQQKLFADSSADQLLGGTIMEFCARYQTLLGLLEKHDKEKIFLNMIETGVFGKVFAVLAPVADEVHRSREVFTPQKAEIATSSTINNTAPLSESSEKQGFFDRLKPSKKESEKPVPAKDAFSLALERSFSSENTAEEPIFEINHPEEDSMPEPQIDTSEESVISEDIVVKEAEPSDTQKTLDSLKKEWQELDVSSEKEGENLAYPFGGWTDAEKYQK